MLTLLLCYNVCGALDHIDSLENPMLGLYIDVFIKGDLVSRNQHVS